MLTLRLKDAEGLIAGRRADLRVEARCLLGLQQERVPIIILEVHRLDDTIQARILDSAFDIESLDRDLL